MKHTANIITVLRIILSLLLIPLREHLIIFTIIYILCGLTDVLDGIVARRAGTQSKLGARLDSASDLIMFAVIVALLLLWAPSDLLTFLPFILIIFAIRMASLVISMVRHKTLMFIHTVANKMTGLLLFITPLVFALLRSSIIFWPVCIAALLSALEEAAIQLFCERPDVNQKSLFVKRRP